MISSTSNLNTAFNHYARTPAVGAREGGLLPVSADSDVRAVGQVAGEQSVGVELPQHKEARRSGRLDEAQGRQANQNPAESAVRLIKEQAAPRTGDLVIKTADPIGSLLDVIA